MAARSSYEEGRFGQNIGGKANKSRDVAPPSAKKTPAMDPRTRRELGLSPKSRPKVKGAVPASTRRELGV